MEPVTPVVNRARKSVAFLDGHAASPLRRTLGKITTPVHDPKVNDDLERNKRRSNVDLQRRLMHLPQASPGPNENSYSDKECEEHILSVLKMYAENKICQKNAWHIKIIDYMRVVLKPHGFKGEGLQVATTSLDASAKVYAIRVDDIHSEGLKLASSMARASQKTNRKNNEDDMDEEYQEGAGEEGGQKDKPQKKRKKKRFERGQKNTIVKDPKTLFAEFPKLESTSYRSKSDNDNIGATTLFCLSLPMDYSGASHLLCHEKQYCYEEPLVEIKENDPFQPPSADIRVCPLLNDFQVDKWDPERENELLSQQADFDKDVQYDDAGLPIPELDGSVHDDFENPPMEHDMSDEEEAVIGHTRVTMQDDIRRISDFRPSNNLDVRENDYTYLHTMHDKFTQLIFAGPSHWKLKHLRQSYPRYSGQVQQQAPKPKKQKVQCTVLDLENPHTPFDMAKEYTRKNRIPNDPLKVTLPMNLLLEISGNQIWSSREVEFDCNFNNTKISYEARPYDYNNPNDSQYCSQNSANNDHDNCEDGFDNRDEIHEEVHEEIVDCQRNQMCDNLVEAPEMVEKNYIQYMKTAKRMDMKKLKTTIWKSIVASDKVPYDRVSEANMLEMPAQKHTFAEVLDRLPERLNEKMREELSPHLAFIAVLHLCNEHDLKLIGDNSLRDFTILQDKA